MRLNKVSIRNFKCFKNAEFVIPENGFYFLTGENQQDTRLETNGIGKSTLCDAIQWALFKETSDGTRAAEILNTNGDGAGYSVTLHFDKHTVERTWKPISFKIDGRECHDKEIQSILPLTIEQFRRSIYIAQEGAGYFVDETPGAKLDFLSKLFDLDNWLKYSDNLKQKAVDKKNEAAFVENDISNLLVQIEQIKNDITTTEFSVKGWQDTQQEEINQLLTLIVQGEDRVEQLPDIRDVQNEAVKATEMLKQNEQKLQAVRVQERTEAIRISNLKAEIKRQNNEIEKYMSAVDTVCIECKQTVSIDHAETMALKLVENVTALESQVDEDKLQHMTAIIFDLEKLMAEGREALAALNTGIIETQKHISEQNQLQFQIEAWRAQADGKQREINPYLDMLATFEKKKTALDISIANAKGKLEKIDQDRALFELGQKHFTQIRIYILNKLVAHLQISFNQAFANLGLFGWSVEINTERELATSAIKKEITLKILKDGKEKLYKGLSGGEKQRVRLASAIGISDLVLNYLGVDLNFRLFDEPSGGLSKTGTSDMLESIGSLGEFLTVFLADHRLFEGSLFTGVYRIIKAADGNSEIFSA